MHVKLTTWIAAAKISLSLMMLTVRYCIIGQRGGESQETIWSSKTA